METVNVRSVEKATGSKGNQYLKLILADDSAIFAWDTKLFAALENAGGGVAKLDVDRTRQYPRVITVHSVEHNAISANGSGGTMGRDEAIRRQVALKAAVESAGLCASQGPEVEAYLAFIRKLADGYLEWLENPTPF